MSLSDVCRVLILPACWGSRKPRSGKGSYVWGSVFREQTTVECTVLDCRVHTVPYIIELASTHAHPAPSMDDLQPNVRVLGECCPRRRVQCGCPYFGAVVGSKFEVFSFSYFSHIL